MQPITPNDVRLNDTAAALKATYQSLEAAKQSYYASDRLLQGQGTTAGAMLRVGMRQLWTEIVAAQDAAERAGALLATVSGKESPTPDDATLALLEAARAWCLWIGDTCGNGPQERTLFAACERVFANTEESPP